MIIGPVAKLLGYLMEGIFFVIDKIGIPNIGLAIILFTIIINILMLPLTVKQQKFSKLNAKMSPELNAIRKKYEGKKDNDSVMAMNQESQEVYAKYGVSPTGSCLQLLIQMPILFALYRVIYAMPAYVDKIRQAFFPLVDELIAQAGGIEFIQSFKNSRMYMKQFNNELFTSGNVEYVQNTVIDCLNKASTSEWLSISEKFPQLASDVSSTLENLDVYNSFLGLNIANSPSYMIGEAFKSGAYLLVVGALMIPVLAAFTQWVNTKLMPSPASAQSGDGQDAAMQSMKMMNTTMPLMSAVFCFTLPAGLGLYWIAGAVVRSIIQVAINKHIDNMDLDAMIEKNLKKNAKKLEKNKEQAAKLNAYANMNTKNVDRAKTPEEKEAALRKAQEQYKNGAKPGSIAAKANKVREYNERNNK